MAPDVAKEASFTSLSFLMVLAIQVGIQPIITKICVNEEVNKTIILRFKVFWLVLACELVKLLVGFMILILDNSFLKEFHKWSFRESIVSAALPAMIYSVQNTLIWVAYQNTTGLLFNMINQTKTIFAAVFVFLILKKGQTKEQIFSLFLLVISAVTISFPSEEDKESGEERNSVLFGAIAALSASILSGLASSLCQWTLQGQNRNPTVFSMELGVYSGCFVIISNILNDKVFDLSGWNHYTFLPVFTQAMAGLVIGQVTKRSGGIQKGFSVCGGVVLTAVLEDILGLGPSLGLKHLIGFFLLIVSLYMYSSNAITKAKQE